MIMSDKSSLNIAAWQWTQVTVVIHPCLLVVLSTLNAWRGGIGQDIRRRHWTREGSMKFPVAPQSMRAMVATVLTPYCSRMGNQIAHSDLFATSTEAMTEEEDVVATPCSKKTLRLFCWLPQQVGEVVTTCRVSSLFPPILSHISQGLTCWAWWQ